MDIKFKGVKCFDEARNNTKESGVINLLDKGVLSLVNYHAFSNENLEKFYHQMSSKDSKYGLRLLRSQKNSIEREKRRKKSAKISRRRRKR